jgi:hypothetical protein
MAVWSTPRTWVDSPTPDVATAALLDQYVTQNLQTLRNGNNAYCKLYLTTNPSISMNTNTPVSWNKAVFNVGGIWSAANADRLTAPLTGKYLVLANVEWRQNSTNLRSMNITRSAGGAAQYDLQSQGANGGKSNLSAALVVNLTAGQFLRLQVFQSTTGSLTLHGGTQDRTRIAMVYLGDGTGAWADPFTWPLTVTPTAAQLNQEWKNNFNTLRGLNDCFIRVHRTSVQSLSSNSRVPIQWQAAAYQNGITWASSPNPSRLIAPVSGTYLLAANIKFANVVGNRRELAWHRLSATNVNYNMQGRPGNGVDTVTGLDFVDLVAGDGIEVLAFQNTGANLNTAGTTEGDCWAHLSLFAQDYRPTPPWTDLPPWKDGYPDGVVSAARLNAIRDQVRHLRSWKGAAAAVWLDDDQSVSQGQREPIRWAHSNRNVGNLWDGSSKFVAPYSGVYLVDFNAEWDNRVDNSGYQGIGYVVNQSATKHDLQFQEGSNAGENMSGVDLIYLRKNDELELYASHDSSESISLKGGTRDRTRATVALVAAA